MSFFRPTLIFLIIFYVCSVAGQSSTCPAADACISQCYCQDTYSCLTCKTNCIEQYCPYIIPTSSPSSSSGVAAGVSVGGIVLLICLCRCCWKYTSPEESKVKTNINTPLLKQPKIIIS